MNRRVFWMILIAFHACFFGKQVFFGNSLLQDSREYLYAADNIVKHQTLYAWNLNHAYDKNWLSKRPFLYPSFLVICRLLSFGSDTAFFSLVYLFQNLASLLGIFLVLKIARKFSLNIRWWPSLVFLLISLSQVIYANLVMSEIWLQLCMILIVYILLCRNGMKYKILYVSILLIAGMSLKPVLMITAFLFPVIYLLSSYKQFIIRNFIFTILPLVFYFSICKFNEKRSGYFHYSSISNINLLHYNTYSLLMNKLGQHSADSIVDEIRLQAKLKNDYRLEQIYIKEACSKILFDNKGLYAYLHIRGMLLCLADPGRYDFTQFFNLPHSGNLIYETNKEGGFKRIVHAFINPLGFLLILLIVFNLFKLWVILRFTFSIWVAWSVRLLILCFPVYILSLTGPIGTSRFFMPLIPIIWLMFLFITGKERKRL